jgi:hypothetical protein
VRIAEQGQNLGLKGEQEHPADVAAAELKVDIYEVLGHSANPRASVTPGDNKGLLPMQPGWRCEQVPGNYRWCHTGKPACLHNVWPVRHISANQVI